MENIKLVKNQNVIKQHYTVEVSAKDLYLLGWNFEQDIQNLVSIGITYKDARLRLLSTPIRFHFETNEAGENAFFWYFAQYGAEYRFTGGENTPIEDLITLIENGLYSLDTIVDYSEDVDGNYCGFLTRVII